MVDKLTLAAVGASFVIALSLVPAASAVSAAAGGPPELEVCVRVDLDDPSVGVHTRCDGTTDGVGSVSGEDVLDRPSIPG